MHLRRLVTHATRGASTPAAATSPHPAANRTTSSTAPTAAAPSLANLKDYRWWHHHVVLHELGWKLTAHPDGTSQATSLDGKIIRSHSPRPAPGDMPRGGCGPGSGRTGRESTHHGPFGINNVGGNGCGGTGRHLRQAVG